jgi:heat shock protein HtpX
MLGTIVILAWYASRFMLFGGMGRSRSSSSSGGGGGAQIIVLVAAIVLMILAPIMAQLIYFAISRKREYMADASSALYTRYPEGLASALEKIAASTGQLKSANQATAPMYIMNPFRKEGRAASNLTSTHPPISERVRILRSMAGASFADYEQVYQKVHGVGKGVIPASALALSHPASLRAAGAEPAEPDRTEKARQTSDLMWRLGNYKTITCDCGTKLRVPPKFKEPAVRCPHCGRSNPV